MEKWEYMTAFLWADATTKRSNEYLKRRWPDWQPPKFAPQAMIPELDDLGDQGWELVHMQPVAGVGKNWDVHSTGVAYAYSNAYFCVFKRRKSDSD